jgi:4-amino-4-deoxy-L-arabinose transferase-like glycosyltransferase
MLRTITTTLTIVLLLAAAVLLAALLTPRPWHLDVGAPGDAYYLSGAFNAEDVTTSLRWTGAQVELQLFGAFDGRTILTARLYREPATPDPWPLELSDPTTPPATFATQAGWRTYEILLPADAERRITLLSPTFQPGAGDPRDLGVAIDAIGLEPVRTAPPLGKSLIRWGFLIGVATLLGGGITLAAAWLRAEPLLRRRTTPRPSFARLFGLLATTLGVGALAAWAWLHPPSLDWMLPTNWANLAWGAAAMVVLTLALRFHADERLPAIRTALRAARLPLVVAGWLLAHAALFAPLPPAWHGVAALLILAAPGALAALAFFAHAADRGERIFLAGAGATAVAAMLVLALHALPGPLTWWSILIAADTLTVFGAIALQRSTPHASRPSTPATPSTPHALPRPTPSTPATSSANRWLVLVLLCAAALRLFNLGRNDFQGDEAYVLLLARGVLHGQPDSLMVHMKGPVEALLPAGLLGLTGTITEWVARLPFALAGLGVLLGVALLPRRLIGGARGSAVGLVAAAILSLDGFLIAFSRIVQYQSVVMLMAVAALWLAWRFAEDAASGRRYLYAAAFCAAVGALAHYDGAFIAPALAWMVFLGARRRGWGLAQTVRAASGPTLLGIGLCLSFYLPFVLHEHFASTLGHLGTRSGQRSALPSLYNNLPGYIELAGFYSTVYYVTAAGALLLGGLSALMIAYLRPRPLAIGLATLLSAGMLIALLQPAWVDRTPEWSFAAFLIVPPLIALAGAPTLPAGLRTIVLWYAAPLLAMAFLLADPRTHFYTTHPAGALLAAWAVVTLWERLQRPRLHTLRWPLVAAGVALVALILPFTRQAFLTAQPEYERAYPTTLLALYTPPSGAVAPDDGLFAFARADGWKTVAELYRSGALSGSFDTNVEVFVPGWYLRGQFRCAREPDQFITVLAEQPLYIPPGYYHHTTITAGGVPKLALFSRTPAAGPLQTIDAAASAAAFDATPIPNFPLRRLLSGPVPQHRVETAWSDGFNLRGFDLDRANLGPNGSAFLTLYWRAAAPLAVLAQPEVLIRDAAGNAIARAPTFCGGIPSPDWHRDKVNDTPFRLDAATLPPGRYTLSVAVRDRATDAWLPLRTGATELYLSDLVINPD